MPSMKVTPEKFVSHMTPIDVPKRKSFGDWYATFIFLVLTPGIVAVCLLGVAVFSAPLRLVGKGRFREFTTCTTGCHSHSTSILVAEATLRTRNRSGGVVRTRMNGPVQWAGSPGSLPAASPAPPPISMLKAYGEAPGVDAILLSMRRTPRGRFNAQP